MSWAKFFSVVKGITNVAGQFGVPVITAINPVAGVITGKILSGIVAAEQAIPAPGTGATKASMVMASIAGEIPVLMGTLESITGTAVVDQAKLQAGLAQINDGWTAVLNATGNLKGLGAAAAKTAPINIPQVLAIPNAGIISGLQGQPLTPGNIGIAGPLNT